MSNTEKIQKIFQSLSGEIQKVTAVPKELIHFLSSPSKAVLLAQLIYWSDKGGNKKGFIWKSYAEIFDETGIKQKTCNRHYNEFREMGFFDWKQKLAGGKNVIHYKLDMDKLTESIKTYWLSRNGQNDQLELVKMSNSITENTTKITTKITSINKTTLSHSTKEKSNFGKKSPNDKLNDKDEMSFTNVLINAGFVEEMAVALPTNFEPSLENQFWAVSNFPKKSVKLTTQGFVEYHQENSAIVKTISGWQTAWRKWMREERGQFGYCEDKLEFEQKEITTKVVNLIHLFALECGNSFIRRDDLYF